MGDKYKLQSTELTRAEIIYLILHPHHVSIIRSDAGKALAEARRRFPSGLHNGEGDAFRHCYWSALLARDIGPGNAKRFTGAHEDFDGNPSKEKAMDLHNNSVGIEIGRRNPKGSDRTLADLAAQALRNGQLITSPG